MKSKFVELAVQLSSAQKRLEEVMLKPKDEFIRDSAIQRFEFTFELAWKTLKSYLEEKRGGSQNLYFPKDVFRSAFQAGMIEDNPEWLYMVDTRNATSHIYNEAMAENVYEKIPIYLPLLRKLVDNLGY